MLIPVRCFTCNKVIGQKWNPYNDKVTEYLSSGDTEMNARGKALDDVGLVRYCCRRMLLSHVNIIDQLLQYANNPSEKIVSSITPEESEQEDEEN